MALSDANITGLYFLASAIIPAVIPVLILLINNRTARVAAEAARKEAADIAKAAVEAAAARDAEADRVRKEIASHIATVGSDLTQVKADAAKAAAQSDGIIEKVSALAEAAGIAKGTLAGQKAGEDTGKARAEEMRAVVTEAVNAAGKEPT